MIPPRKTRTVHIRHLALGGFAPDRRPEHGRDPDARHPGHGAPGELILEDAGADLVRIAVDSEADVEALAQVARADQGLLSVDLQENYRLAELVAPLRRQDPLQPRPPAPPREGEADRREGRVPRGRRARARLALRIGINAGSIAPEYEERFPDDHVAAIVECAVDHCGMVDELGFRDYVVSIKDSDPRLVIDANMRFAARAPTCRSTSASPKPACRPRA
jgi:(E)-4-hydroxy-3-methylbut-2-enyl-diphosphate synthase